LAPVVADTVRTTGETDTGEHVIAIVGEACRSLLPVSDISGDLRDRVRYEPSVLRAGHGLGARIEGKTSSRFQAA